MDREPIEIIQYCKGQMIKRIPREEPRGLLLEIVTHPGGTWTGKKHYRFRSRSGGVVCEIAAKDDTAGRRAAWDWIRKHNIKVRRKVYRQT